MEREEGRFYFSLDGFFRGVKGAFGCWVFLWGGWGVVRKGREGEGGKIDLSALAFVWVQRYGLQTHLHLHLPLLPTHNPLIPTSILSFFYVPPPLTRFESSNKNIPIPKPATHDSPHALIKQPRY